MGDEANKVMAYRVVRWLDLYEVDEFCRPYDPAGKAGLRKGRLAYVRLQVAGHGCDLSKTAQALFDHCCGLDRQPIAFHPEGPQWFMNAVATFDFCQRNAADRSADLRGWILAEDGSPADADRVASMSRFPLDAVSRALQHLTECRLPWLERVPFPPAAVASSRQQLTAVDCNGLQAPLRQDSRASSRSKAASSKGGGLLLRLGVPEKRLAEVAEACAKVPSLRILHEHAEVAADKTVKCKGAVLASRLAKPLKPLDPGSDPFRTADAAWNFLTALLQQTPCPVEQVNGATVSDLEIRGERGRPETTGYYHKHDGRLVLAKANAAAVELE